MSLGQDNWRFCRKCNCLFYAGPAGDNPGKGACAAGGGHDGVRSANYVLDFVPAPGHRIDDNQ